MRSPRPPLRLADGRCVASCAGCQATVAVSRRKLRAGVARAEVNARHALPAHGIAAPVLEKHGDLPTIQALRCDIAMAIGGDWDTISGECAGLSALGKLQ